MDWSCRSLAITDWSTPPGVVPTVGENEEVPGNNAMWKQTEEAGLRHRTY